MSATTEISPTLQVDTPTNTTTQSVTVTSTTATIPRSLSDKDGIKDYTCQAYSGSTPIGSLVSATDTSCNLSGLAPSTSYLFVEKALTAQKKPNGDIVWVVREVRTPFTTSTPDNIPGTISTPTVQSKTYNSITLNTVTASADISDIMYVLLDARGTEVRRSATPVFVGLSASTTYRAHIEYKDKNESTNLQEVKVTPDVTVITDSAPAIPPTSTICANQTVTLGAANYNCTFSTNSLGAKTWSTNNPAVATVDTNGTITYVGVGTATITVSTAATPTHLAESKQLSVTVNAPAWTPPTLPATLSPINTGDTLVSFSVALPDSMRDQSGNPVPLTISGLPSVD